MSSTAIVESFGVELKNFIQESFLEAEGATVCHVDEPLQKISVHAGPLRCRKCYNEEISIETFVSHLVECYEGTTAATRYRRYNLHSRQIQQLLGEAQLVQQKNLFIPIKGLPSKVLRVPYNSSLSRLFTAGAILRITQGNPALSSPLFLNCAQISQTGIIYADFSNLYKQSLLLSNINKVYK